MLSTAITVIAIFAISSVFGKNTRYAGLNVGKEGVSGINEYIQTSDKLYNAFDKYINEGASPKSLTEPMARWMDISGDTDLDPYKPEDMFYKDEDEIILKPKVAKKFSELFGEGSYGIASTYADATNDVYVIDKQIKKDTKLWQFLEDSYRLGVIKMPKSWSGISK